jgi:diguanylate cyclase (GGDEF)-like protein
MPSYENYLREQMELLSESAQRLEAARKRASVDPLTGLVSRAKAEACLLVELNAGRSLTVFLIDLVGFKRINERWGHQCGDQILREVGRLLVRDSGDTHLICRWGGDRFLRLSVSDNSSPDEEIKGLCAFLSRGYQVAIDNGSVRVDVVAKIGFARSNGGDTWERLMRRAEEDLDNRKLQFLCPSGGVG